MLSVKSVPYSIVYALSCNFPSNRSEASFSLNTKNLKPRTSFSQFSYLYKCVTPPCLDLCPSLSISSVYRRPLYFLIGPYLSLSVFSSVKVSCPHKTHLTFELFFQVICSLVCPSFLRLYNNTYFQKNQVSKYANFTIVFCSIRGF